METFCFVSLRQLDAPFTGSGSNRLGKSLVASRRRPKRDKNWGRDTTILFDSGPPLHRHRRTQIAFEVPALTKAVWRELLSPARRQISRRGRVGQARGSAKLPPKGSLSFLVISPSPYGLG